MNLYTESAAFADALKSIVNSGKRLDRSIQRFAVSAILHATVNGNPCHINDLIANMPKGSRVNAIRDWFKTFGPVEYNKQTKVFDLHKDKAELGRTEITDGAVLPEVIEVSVTTPWTDFAPDAPYAPIDFSDMILKAVTVAQKRLDADENKGDKIDTDLLAAVKSLLVTS